MAADALLRLAVLSGRTTSARSRGVRRRVRLLAPIAAGRIASSYANAMARALAEPLSITVVGPKDDATALPETPRAPLMTLPEVLQRIVPEYYTAASEIFGVSAGSHGGVRLRRNVALRAADGPRARSAERLERTRGRLECVKS